MQIIYPTLLLDKQKCLENIRFMCEKAERLKLRLRPHFKTHQSAQIGSWFRECGVTACTVSSIKMAFYFLEHGWDDINLAFPINPLAIEDINRLATKANLSTVIVSEKTLDLIKDTLNSPLKVYIKIDTGSHRTGILPENTFLIERLLQKIEENRLLKFKGFLAHSGHTYNARSKEEVEKIHEREIEIMKTLKTRFAVHYPALEISVGDTPACSISENYDGVDEIRPGNYVFYDIMQYYIGSCNHHQIAIALGCPVVARHPERNEIVVHGGAVHLSKETIQSPNGLTVYGYVVYLKDGGWTAPVEGAYVRALSQEHGIIRCNDKVFNSVLEGDVIGILPVHACLTADLMKEYHTLDGERIEMMR